MDKHESQIIRDEHNADLNAKKVTLVSSATINAVVNTSAAADSVLNIGFATVSVSNPTLYAVVNTGAAGDSTAKIGFATVAVASSATLFAVVNTAAAGQASIVLDNSISNIGFATVNVANTARSIVGNLTLSDSKAYIGLTTTTLASSIANIGFATVDVVNTARSILGNITLSDSKAFIGLVSVSGLADKLNEATFTGRIGEVDANPTANTVMARLKGISELFLPDGHNVNVANEYVPVSQSTIPWYVSITGNVTLSDSKAFIGLTTTTLGASPAFVGIVTIANASMPVTFSGNVTLDAGSKTQIVGNVTLSDSKTFIGLTTTTLASSIANIGFATVSVSNLARTITGNVTLSDSKTYIGLVTATPVGLVTVIQGTSPWVSSIIGNVTLSDSKAYVGLTTTTLGIGTQFIGLATTWSRNAGTTKTLIPKNIEMSVASIMTIAVPSATFKITNLLVSSNATVRVSIKSGATYLTGNASIGVTLFPGGGWVETGSPDSPTYSGLAAAAAIVFEKFDTGGIISNIAGKVIYFDE